MKKYKFDNITISFEESKLLDYINNHIRNSDKETGGVLCGYYTEDNISAIITDFLEPTKDSIFGRASFVRGVSGLKEILDKKWKKGEYYLGDWHLHPYSAPIASGQDVSQLIRNSKDSSLKCPETIMVIVGGKNNKDIKVYACFNNTVHECVEICD
jgi:integrative and conjugative element protein (TIGR02256 family)